MGLKRLFLLFLVLTSFVAPVKAMALYPQWPENGLLINNAIGNTPQKKPQMVIDADGNSIIVWEDSRSGIAKIYAQKIGITGKLLWNKSGILLAVTEGEQNSPCLVSDRQEGVVVVWQENTPNGTDIYAQKISLEGEKLWGEGGIPVCTAEASQASPQILSGSDGCVYIAWHDYRLGTGEDIYAQSLDKEGKFLWPGNGLPICTEKGTQWYPKLAGGGNYGLLLVWADGRKGGEDNDIYIQYVNKKGTPLWEKNGLPVCVEKSNQTNPALTLLEDGVLVVWEDERSENKDIYAQKINLEGKKAWQDTGIGLCTNPANQKSPQVASDGLTNALVVWQDERKGNSMLYAQEIDTYGRMVWKKKNGQPVFVGSKEQTDPQVFYTGASYESWLVVGKESILQDSILYVQKINQAGKNLFGLHGIEAAPQVRKQGNFSGAVCGKGRLYLTWQDLRQGNGDIYAQKILADGKIGWGQKGLLVCDAKGETLQKDIGVVSAKTGEIILSFSNSATGFANFYVQKINARGEFLWGPEGIAVGAADRDQQNAQLAGDGQGGVWVVWEEKKNIDQSLIFVQKINAMGKKVLADRTGVSRTNASQAKPVLMGDGKGGMVVAWQEKREEINLEDIYIQHFSYDGKRLWGEKGKQIVADAGKQETPAMMMNSHGDIFLAWVDYRGSNKNCDIYAQKMGGDGELKWEEGGMPVCLAPDVQRAVKIVSDKNGGAIVFWEDRAAGDYNLYAQRLTAGGKLVWEKDGLPVIAAARTQQNFNVANNLVLVWEDNRFGNWDIFAGKLGLNGHNLWLETGVAVARLDETQSYPQVAALGEGHTLVAWEDERDTLRYKVFLQLLGRDGQNIFPADGIENKTRAAARAPQLLVDDKTGSAYLFWEDIYNGQTAIYGQRFKIEI